MLRGRLHLRLDQVENNWAALGFAGTLGLTPNETLDIHFDRGLLFDPHNRALPCLRAFLKSARQWIERKGHRTTYIWAIENIGDGYGIHAHLLIHVPPALSVRFHQLRTRWAWKAGLNLGAKNVIKRKPLPTVNHAIGKLKYMTKDLDPRHWPIFTDIAGRVHLHDSGKPSDQEIYTKKCGVSRNIDAKARRAYQAQRQAATVRRLGRGQLGQPLAASIA